jgi:phosphatidylglycerophosphatase A
MSKLLGSFFGLGYLPGPAGTYASAVTTVLMFAAYRHDCPWWGIVLAAVVATVVGIIAGRDPEKRFGSKDPKPFVLDEVAGMLIAGFAAWTPWSTHLWLTLPVAFLWFRVTDVTKPPPARQLERLPAGWGIVMDDVAAGLMSLGLTIATVLVLNRIGV